MENILTKYFFFVFTVTIITEIYMSAKWFAPYFTKGIKLVIKQTVLSDEQIEILKKTENHKYQKGMQPTVLLKKISQTEIAIREKFFDFSAISYSAIIHGCLSFDSTRKSITVYGIFNYTIMVFLAMFIGITFQAGDIILSLVVLIFPMLLIFALFYAQRKIYVDALDNLLKINENG